MRNLKNEVLQSVHNRRNQSLVETQETAQIMVVELMPILTHSEVMSLLGVSRSTLTNWEENGILKKNKIGNRVYYYTEDILNHFNLKSV